MGEIYKKSLKGDYLSSNLRSNADVEFHDSVHGTISLDPAVMAIRVTGYRSFRYIQFDSYKVGTH